MATYEIITLNFPNSIRTNATAINDLGDVAGDFTNKDSVPSSSWDVPDFLYVNGKFTSVSFGAGQFGLLDEALLINNNDLVIGDYGPGEFAYDPANGGSYTDLGSVSITGLNDSDVMVGGKFIRDQGMDVSGTLIVPLATGYWGNIGSTVINDSGEIAGNYTVSGDSAGSTQSTHGFVMQGGHWISTADQQWDADAIYNTNDVVFYTTTDGQGTQHTNAFVSLSNNNTDNAPLFSMSSLANWEEIDVGDVGASAFVGTVTTLDFPGANVQFTAVDYIETNGDVVGHYEDNSFVTHYFVYDGTNFTALADPLAANNSTGVIDVSRGGMVLGDYRDANNVEHFFVYDGKTYSDVTNLPSGAMLSGINDDGDIVGTINGNTISGFIATPGPDVPAAAIVWAKGVSGDFATAKNWNPATVPGDGDYAAITPSGTYTVTSTADETVAGLITAAGATLNLTGGMFDITDGTNTVVSGAIAAGVNAGKITVGAGASLDIAGTTFANAATGLLQASGAGAEIDIDDITIAGGTLKTLTGGAIKTVADTDNTLDGSGKNNPVNNTGTVTVVDNSSLTLKGTINNTGMIALQGDADPTVLAITGNFLLQGAAGKVTMSDSDNNAIASNGSAATLNNVNNTISGAGTIGDAHLTLNNQVAGIINGSAVNNALVLDTGATAITNAGTLEGSNTGGLEIDSVVNNSNLIEALGTGAMVLVNADIDNSTKGVILASGASAHVELGNMVTIQGGTLKSANGGTIEVSTNRDAALDGSNKTAGPVNNAATVVLLDGSSLTLAGTINNTGAFLLDGDTAETDLVIANDITLSGAGGKVLMSDSDNNVITTTSATVTASDPTLTNADTIAGAGHIGTGGDDLTLVNLAAGIINGNQQNNALVLDTGEHHAISNLGTLEGSNTGGLDIESVVGNQNLIEALGAGAKVHIGADIDNTTKGVILASGTGAHVDLDGITIQGGTLKTALLGEIRVVSDTHTTILDGTAKNLPVTIAGTVVVEDGTSLTLQGAINNTGTIAMAGSVNETDLEIVGVFQLQGTGGKVTMTDSPGNVIESNGSDATLNNVNNTISGAGTIGEGAGGHLTLNNLAAGVVNGSGVNNALVLDTGAKAITNVGILEGSNTGGLEIDSAVNNSNLIEALGTNAKVAVDANITSIGGKGVLLASGTGAHVDLDGVSIIGGTLKTALGGVISVTDDSTLDGTTAANPVNNTGTVVVADGNALTLKGVINNTGTLSLAGNATETDLDIVGNFLLQGAAGKVLMSDSDQNVIQSNGSTASLTNVNNIISGAGTIGDDKLSLTNQVAGIINGSGVNNALVLEPTGIISNLGTLEGSNTGGLDIESSVNNQNLIEALGTNAKVTIGALVTNNGTKAVIMASGTGAHVDLDGVTITGGVFKTASGGAINVTADSTISGVSNTGTLNIEANTELTVQSATFSNTATGVINVIGGADPAFLEIAVSTTLSGGGKINLSGDAHIVGNGSTLTTLTNVDNTIQGVGTIGDSKLGISNQAKGVINGDGASGSLAIESAAPIGNAGTLEGTGSGGLDIESDVTNANIIEALGTNAKVLLDGVTITNSATGKIIASGTGAHVDLDDQTHIVGGTLSTTGTGVIQTVSDSAVFFDGSTKVGAAIVPVNNTGSVQVNDNSSLILKGTINNTGTISVISGGNDTDLDVSGIVTLKGTGKITMADNAFSDSNAIGTDGNPGTLINAGNTISGAGAIGGDPTGGMMTVDNQAAGIINATGTHELLIEVATFTNEGKVEATGTGGLHVVDTVIANSVTGLVTTLAAGTHIDLDHAGITGGSLSVFKGSVVEAVNGQLSTIGSPSSAALNTKVTNAGTISANGGDLTVAQGFANTGTLDANNAHLTLQGAITGAGNATIEGTGTVEFAAASTTQNVAFGAGAAGTLQLDHSLTFKGTVSGFAPAPGMDFSNFLAFGDSTIDSGWFPTAIVNGDTANQTGSSVKDTLIMNALDKGGTGAPVGFGFMNSQLLADDFGYSAVPADEPGGGTNYAIAGAVTIADAGGTHQNAPAGGDTVDLGNGSIGNLNKNPALPSTVQQIDNYLTTNGGNADPNALYLISTGGNDTTFANNDMPGDTKAQKQAYLMHQAEALADEIGILQGAGAETIVVHSLAGDDPTANSGAGNFATLFDNTLFGALDAAHVHYIKSDVAAMKNAITANPTVFGFTAGTVAIGTAASTTTSSAFIDFDSIDNSKGVPTPIQTGWGQWGAPIGYNDGSDSYAYLRAPNAEFTSLYSDDQHFSTQGQQIEADYDLAQIFAAGAAAMDSIDLRDIAYAFGTTTATYAGTKTGGTLTVTDSVHHTTTKLTLTGDYTTANFVTTTDGHGGTAVIEAAPSASAAADVMFSHLLDTHYAGAIVAGMNYAVLDFTMTKAVTLAGDSTSIVLSSADVIQTNGAALTLTNNEIVHGGGTIGDAFMTLSNGAAGVIDADDVFGGMTIQTTGHAVANAGTIEALGGGWLRISNTTINNTATAQFKVLGSDGDTHIPSLIDLDHATINGGVVTVGAGAILEAVNGTTSTFSGAVTNSGKLEAFSSSHLTINGAVTGNGSAAIGSDGTLEFGAASDTDVKFVTFSTGNDGKLMLDHATSTASQFTGTISNFLHGNDIDLGAITYNGGANATNDSQAVFDAVHNQLTVSDGTHSIVLTFDADLTVGTDFHVVNDTHGHVDLLHV